MSYSRNETTHAPIEKTSFFKKNGPSSASFSLLFSSFQTNITILTKINVKNLHPVYSAGI